MSKKDLVRKKLTAFAFDGKKSFFKRRNVVNDKAVEFLMLFVDDGGNYTDEIEFGSTITKNSWANVLDSLDMDSRAINVNRELFAGIKSKARKLCQAVSGGTASLEYVPSRKVYKIIVGTNFTKDCLAVTNNSMARVQGNFNAMNARVQRSISAMKKSRTKKIREYGVYLETKFKHKNFIDSYSEIRKNLGEITSSKVKTHSVKRKFNF